MALEIPNLTGTHIDKLYVACYIENSDPELTAWIEHVGARHQTRINEGWWLHDFYFTFPVADQNPTSCAILTLDKEGAITVSDPEIPLDMIQERFSHFAGRNASVRLMSTFRIPLERIPKNGKIDALIGVTTDVGKTRLEYTGAKTRVHGSIFNTFNWELIQVTKPERAQIIEATVDAWMWNYGQLSDNLLTNSVPLASKAFDCFVLDKPCDDSICLNEDRGETK